jgi:hypothetical protein
LTVLNISTSPVEELAVLKYIKEISSINPPLPTIGKQKSMHLNFPFYIIITIRIESSSCSVQPLKDVGKKKREPNKMSTDQLELKIIDASNLCLKKELI